MVISFHGLDNTDLRGMTSGFQATAVPGNKALVKIFTGQEPIMAKIMASSSNLTTLSSSWRVSLQTGISSTQ